MESKLELVWRKSKLHGWSIWFALTCMFGHLTFFFFLPRYSPTPKPLTLTVSWPRGGLRWRWCRHKLFWLRPRSTTAASSSVANVVMMVVLIADLVVRGGFMVKIVLVKKRFLGTYDKSMVGIGGFYIIFLFLINMCVKIACKMTILSSLALHIRIFDG